jgi:hypothetical protein
VNSPRRSPDANDFAAHDPDDLASFEKKTRQGGTGNDRFNVHIHFGNAFVLAARVQNSPDRIWNGSQNGSIAQKIS